MALVDALMEFLPGDPKARTKCVDCLGTPLEATCRNRLMLAGFWAFAAVLVGTALWAAGMELVRLVQGGSLSVALLVGVPVFCGAVAGLIIFVTRRRARDFVGVYEQGVAFDTGNGTVRSIRWEEVKTFHKEMFDVNGAPRDTYRLELLDGSMFTWNSEFERHRDVGLCVDARLNQYEAQRQHSIPGELA